VIGTTVGGHVGSPIDWISIAVTLFLGLAGLFLARNINRDVRLKLAERRLAAYERLWAQLRPVSPYDPPPDADVRDRLRGSLTDWYYANGDGMLLPRLSREVYLRAKDNLGVPLDELIPEIARRRLRALEPAELEAARGRLHQRQLSLLRTQLKGDLAIYGRPYGPPLDMEDRAFLEHCGVRLDRKPWSSSRHRTEARRWQMVSIRRP
jgi:hypothetical protein